MKVLILGASGMLGNAMLRMFSEDDAIDVYGSVRNNSFQKYFPANLANKLVVCSDITRDKDLSQLIATSNPDVVINCVGVTKHLSNADDPLIVVPINTLLPHRLEKICSNRETRVIHISTDCVFSGTKGNYLESDNMDVSDLYGVSKYLGELHSPNSITIRTSIIGHELNSQYGLLEWFLSQASTCNGYTKAIFSGLPTVVLAKIIRDIVIPMHDLSGLYHVASKPIAKYDLLLKIAEIYGKGISIIPDDSLVIDRSLSADLFRDATGYSSPEWSDLIKEMHNYYKNQDDRHV